MWAVEKEKGFLRVVIEWKVGSGADSWLVIDDVTILYQFSVTPVTFMKSQCVRYVDNETTYLDCFGLHVIMWDLYGIVFDGRVVLLIPSYVYSWTATQNAIMIL